MECPSSDQWIAYAAGVVTHLDRANLGRHAEGCTRCRGVLTSLAANPTVAQSDPPPMTPPREQIGVLGPGSRVGRYVIERTLGAGGMGVVYVARDPELDRRVAIKLLRAGTPGRRLRREAQALARLDHPNVVAIYDVGEHQGQCFVAMALVEGKTLRQWLATPRPIRETIRVIIEAGRGLAAAHAGGLIHRDLKPDNVFVSDRGHALVGDFGLARALDDDDDGPGLGAAETGLTMDGAVVGTPAYMAPEQARGDPTVASDQFALCVTAWEALYGARPFAGLTFDDVLEAASAGRITEPPKHPGVPKRVRRALERGLAANPAARWPSVEALLSELAGDRARRRRTIALAAAGGAVVFGGAWAVARATHAPATRCKTGDARMAEVWSPARSAEIRDAVVKIAPYAQTSIDHAIEQVDAYARRWRGAWDDTCRAEVSEVGFDLRVACLEQRLRAIATVADTLRTTDRQSARYVLDVAAGLPALEHCDDLISLRKVAPPPPGLAEPVAELERRIAKGDALTHEARFHEAKDILERALQDATALGNTAARAHAELAMGTYLLREEHFVDAKPHAEAALNAAIASSDDEAAARAYVMQTAAALGLADAPHARELDATADAALHRIGDPADLRARLSVLDASIPLMAGDLTEAQARIGKTIPKLESTHHQREALTLYRMQAAVMLGLGRLDEAHAAHDHEVDANRELLGVKHPDYADARIARGSFLFMHQDYAGATADFEIGYQILVDTLGADDLMTVKAGAELAGVDAIFGRYDDAIAKLRHQVDAVTHHTGPEDEASAHRDLSEALMLAGRVDDAARELDRASALDRTIEGPYHLADDLDLAKIYLRRHALDDAQKQLDRLEPELVKLLGADNPALAEIWIFKARMAIARGHAAAAVPLLAKVSPTVIDAAEAQVVLAEALDLTRDRVGAKAARDKAIGLLDKMGPGARPDLRAELAPKR